MFQDLSLDEVQDIFIGNITFFLYEVLLKNKALKKKKKKITNENIVRFRVNCSWIILHICFLFI